MWHIKTHNARRGASNRQAGGWYQLTTTAARLQHQASEPQGGSSKQPTDRRAGASLSSRGGSTHPTAAARQQHQASEPQGGSSEQPTDSRGGSIPGEAPASPQRYKNPDK